MMPPVISICQIDYLKTKVKKAKKMEGSWESQLGTTRYKPV